MNNANNSSDLLGKNDSYLQQVFPIGLEEYLEFEKIADLYLQDTEIDLRDFASNIDAIRESFTEAYPEVDLDKLISTIQRKLLVRNLKPAISDQQTREIFAKWFDE